MVQRSTQVESLVLRVVAGSEPAGRLQALSELRRELDVIESELAADAVRSGMSWREIGAALGVSKQAAHRRHREGVASAGGSSSSADSAQEPGVAVSIQVRRAVRLARQEAARLGSAEVGTEHLLLGILRCGDDQVIDMLGDNGVTFEAVNMVVRTSAGTGLGSAGGGDGDTEQAATLVAPPTRRIVQRALAHAAARDSRELTALDLLGSIVMHDDAGAARTLSALGVDIARLRADILSPPSHMPRTA